MQPENTIKKIQVQSVSEAIKSQSPTLYNLGAFDKVAPAMVLTFLLEDVLAFLNVGKTMDATQVLQTIELILNDPVYKNFKPDDFKLCFDRAKKGYYGKQYDRIDGQVIFEWLSSYANERADTYEALVHINNNERQKEINESKPNKEGQKRLLEALKPLAEKTDSKKGQASLRLKTPRDQFIQKCFLEHYNIWLKNPAKDEFGNPMKGRFIEFEDKKVTDVEYSEIKLKEYDKQNTL